MIASRQRYVGGQRLSFPLRPSGPTFEYIIRDPHITCPASAESTLRLMWGLGEPRRINLEPARAA